MYTRVPVALIASPHGACPRAMVAVIELSDVDTTLTEFAPIFPTYKLLPSGEITIPCGLENPEMVEVTVFVVVEMTETVLLL